MSVSGTPAAGPILFVLRAFNDADHLAPAAWKAHVSGRAVRVVLADINANQDIQKDPLLRFLVSTGIPVHYHYALPEGGICLPNRLLGSPTHPVAVRVLRAFLAGLRRGVQTRGWADRVIRKTAPKALVVDSHEPAESTIEGKLVFAAKRAAVPVFCLSHGPNVLINFDPKEPGLQRPQKKERVALPGYQVFDGIAAQTPYERRLWKAEGFDLKRVAALGSTRYCPEWMNVSRGFQPPYDPGKKLNGRRRVLFFLPHWRPYTNRQATLNLIQRLSERPDVFLTVKEHTREGAGALPDDWRERFRRGENTDLIESARSVSVGRWARSGFKAKNEILIVDSAPLVDWADVVVCFNSSVGMEALCKRKHLINPAYLCDYATFYEALRAGITVNSEAEFFEALDRILNSGSASAAPAERFEREIIFANQGPHDVLATYVDYLEGHRRA